MNPTQSSSGVAGSLAVTNRLGLHARAAARIAETVALYECEVMLSKDGVEADGASVLSVLTLDAPQGSEITVAVSGDQASLAMGALTELFADKFGEGA